MGTRILMSYKTSDSSFMEYSRLSVCGTARGWTLRRFSFLFPQDVWDWRRAVYLSDTRWGGHLPESPLCCLGDCRAARALATEREKFHGTFGVPSFWPGVYPCRMPSWKLGWKTRPALFEHVVESYPHPCSTWIKCRPGKAQSSPWVTQKAYSLPVCLKYYMCVLISLSSYSQCHRLGSV